MYEPPDFPFKELADCGVNHLFQSDDSILNDTSEDSTKNTEPSPEEPDPLALDNGADSGPTHNTTSIKTEQSAQFFILDSSLISLEPTLLDGNTLILPLQVSEGENKDESADVAGPVPLVTLQTCALCPQLFASPAQLWEHSVAAHYTEYIITDDCVPAPAAAASPSGGTAAETLLLVEGENVVCEETTVEAAAGEDATEWLVCSACERVLSTASEMDASAAEKLCCSSGVERRRLATLFVCERCSALFTAAEALNTHRAACDQQPLKLDSEESESSTSTWYLCDSCQQPYSSTEELVSHAKTCAGAAPPAASPPPPPPPTSPSPPPPPPTPSGKMWNCGSCNQLFITARELYRHKRGEDRAEGAPVTAYICSECDKPLGSVCALHTHRKTHATTKPGYACRVCARRFNQSGHLAIHMRMHTGERPYPCDLCPKAFKVKVERDDHRRTHTGERPFECTSCGKTFTAAARLREHTRIHTDQRPYRCEVCGASFRRPYARTVHALIHTGQKPHACDLCGTAFRRSGDMWKHKRTMHGVSSDTKT